MLVLRRLGLAAGLPDVRTTGVLAQVVGWRARRVVGTVPSPQGSTAEGSGAAGVRRTAVWAHTAAGDTLVVAAAGRLEVVAGAAR